MNTILISGTCKAEGPHHFRYNVNVWASKEGEQIQLITWQSLLFDNYSTLWAYAKSKVMGYFDNNAKFDDGAHTQFLDHLILIN